MSYPESNMNVAAHIGDGVVNIYGYEENGFRPYIDSKNCGDKPSAITFCQEYNDNQRAAMLCRSK